MIAASAQGRFEMWVRSFTKCYNGGREECSSHMSSFHVSKHNSLYSRLLSPVLPALSLPQSAQRERLQSSKCPHCATHFSLQPNSKFLNGGNSLSSSTQNCSQQHIRHTRQNTQVSALGIHRDISRGKMCFMQHRA